MVNNNDWQSFGELFEDYISDNNTGVCIKTGIKQVDDIMRIEESSLTVIAGAKETGKTTLAMQMALQMALAALRGPTREQVGTGGDTKIGKTMSVQEDGSGHRDGES